MASSCSVAETSSFSRSADPIGDGATGSNGFFALTSLRRFFPLRRSSPVYPSFIQRRSIPERRSLLGITGEPGSSLSTMFSKLAFPIREMGRRILTWGQIDSNSIVFSLIHISSEVKTVSTTGQRRPQHNHQSSFEIISFMISVVPPPMERMRLSLERRSTRYPRI